MGDDLLTIAHTVAPSQCHTAALSRHTAAPHRNVEPLKQENGYGGEMGDEKNGCGGVGGGNLRELGVHGFQDTLKEDLELEKQLKLINKPPIKTIHTKNGDIVDCIDIYKQLAFDHPLLKDHKLQRKPSFQKSSMKTLANKPNFNFEKVQCPKGSIPIRRTTKEDLIREKQLLKNSILLQDMPGVHLAELALSSNFSPYYGVRGRSSVYNPPITKGQMSLSHVWVQNGPISSNNKISFGWQVSIDLYGDNKTHLYASWTKDNFQKTGCYNVRCPGFVQTSTQLSLGAIPGDISSYGGPVFDSTEYIAMVMILA
ncbi:uncharacterized protein LOC124839324 [Vigna umbellata]|uniref:uncharacterized protein LOC124839324 n=1 Tax=Vigna umbellata TaxID=87088 RepID=UPI001F5ED205|nr:uncharacterized protein LOC124839324 [Vigna umbellata]